MIKTQRIPLLFCLWTFSYYFRYSATR